MSRAPSLLTIAIVMLLGFRTSACSSPDESEVNAHSPVAQDASTAAVEATMQQVAEAVVQLDEMRSGLAGSIIASENVDAETFTRVCQPVGKSMKQTSAENGWTMRQVASKFRNPANSADSIALSILSQFELDNKLDSLWLRTELDGVSGWRYFHRITVEESCLACHGEKNSRPEFVKEKFPEDRAHGFNAGDLRGLYSVFVADSTFLTDRPE